MKEKTIIEILKENIFNNRSNSLRIIIVKTMVKIANK